ncbi:MAG: hypothetical protein ACXVXV_18740, partial [Blastococcus sp.]
GAGSAGDSDGSAAGRRAEGRRAWRRAAWRRHAQVATAADDAASDAVAEDAAPGSRVRGRADRPLPGIMLGATAGMATLTVALTVLAGPLYGLAHRAAGDLLERTPYIVSVFGHRAVP